MNEREKKLIFILFGAAFLIVNVFLFTSYTAAKQKKEAAIEKNKKSLALKKKEIDESDERIDEMNWLIDHEPGEGSHAAVRAELVTFTEQSARRNGVTSKSRPVPVPENIEEQGAFRTAQVKMIVNAPDREFYRWLVELQNPEKSRSVTRIRVNPQRDDPTRIDCELELTQWFLPATEDNTEEVTSN